MLIPSGRSTSSIAASTHPPFVELATNRPRFVHRFSSDIRNGASTSMRARWDRP
ncbi:hypothetical protein WDA79_09160 [Streptomyces sp. A475]|uniref:hypothetical protein n=1 Tax=Streptomyces sp. A475 TaxID=3131976 RepID=UPI0030C9BFA9